MHVLALLTLDLAPLEGSETMTGENRQSALSTPVPMIFDPFTIVVPLVTDGHGGWARAWDRYVWYKLFH